VNIIMQHEQYESGMVVYDWIKPSGLDMDLELAKHNWSGAYTHPWKVCERVVENWRGIMLQRWVDTGHGIWVKIEDVEDLLETVRVIIDLRERVRRI
jgi:hypothetical protein